MRRMAEICTKRTNNVFRCDIPLYRVSTAEKQTKLIYVLSHQTHFKYHDSILILIT